MLESRKETLNLDLKSFFSKLKLKYAANHRIYDRFVEKEAIWLASSLLYKEKYEDFLEVQETTKVTGRPKKLYDDKSDRSQSRDSLNVRKSASEGSICKAAI